MHVERVSQIRWSMDSVMHRVESCGSAQVRRGKFVRAEPKGPAKAFEDEFSTARHTMRVSIHIELVRHALGLMAAERDLELWL